MTRGPPIREVRFEPWAAAGFEMVVWVLSELRLRAADNLKLEDNR